MTERRATVWFEQQRVGHVLEGPSARIQFGYDTDWLHDGFPISLNLPLSAGTRDVDAHAFFAGLLPEGMARQRLCRQYRLSEDDDMGLLLAIGRDCAGALAVIAQDEEPIVEAPKVDISDEDFSRLVESHGQATPSGATEQRFSLAGAQDKVAVRSDAGRLWLPDATHPSSHILKFETTRRVCFAEYMGNQLAQRLGLRVPVTEYHEHTDEGKTPYLRIERYDRYTDATHRLRRLHQEDMVQALGLGTQSKYQEHGGPSLGDIAKLLRRHCSDPIRDITALRDWQIFNYLTGNSDGHAKNLALLYPAGSSTPALAPFYDLVCIEFLNRLGIRYDRRLALSVGNNSIPEKITRDDWTALAAAIGVPAKRLLERLQQLAEELPRAAGETRQSFAERFGDQPFWERFEESINDRCQWTLRSVFGRG